ncbi:hypothetical protein ACIBL8_21320 [Streptomyces sp. NPDC050523]|uniref:hypothetical protein n=1 Tax=Streptomyces sp. NPDC050523 TaxID=3365622 RepID=UPI0037948CCB
MAIELTDELIASQQAADDAHAKLIDLQNRFTNPDDTEAPVPARDWADEQRAEWDAQQQEWLRLATLAQAAVTQHAKDTQQPRHEVEATLRKLVRHPEPATG